MDHHNGFGAAPRDERAQNTKSSFVANSRYAVVANNDTAYVHDLLRETHHVWRHAQHGLRLSCAPALALSSTGLNLLALSQGPSVLLYDLIHYEFRHHVRAGSRHVHAVAFAYGESNAFATGSADGQLSIWSSNTPFQLRTIISVLQGSCESIAFHPTNDNILAACFAGKVAIVQVQSGGLAHLHDVGNSAGNQLYWPLAEKAVILCVAEHGRIHMLRPDETAIESKTSWDQQVDQGDRSSLVDWFAGPKGEVMHQDIDVGARVRLSQLTTASVLAVAPYNAQELVLYLIDDATPGLTKLTVIPMSNGNFNGVVLASQPSPPRFILFNGLAKSSVEVPGPMTGSLRLNESAQGEKAHQTDRKATPSHRAPLATMRAASLSKEDRGSTPAQISQAPDQPVQRSAWQQLEQAGHRQLLNLPVIEDEEDDSPMPFISPGIPAQKSSFGASTILDDSLQLPPRLSFDSVPFTATDDSDSDDEAFDGHMRSSGTFPPGGVSVPLPRTCGASFAPNGGLVLFMPRKQSASPRIHSTSPTRDAIADRQNFSLTGLFPHFGNLLGTSITRSRSFKSDSGRSSIAEDGFLRDLGRLDSSGDYIAQWSLKSSPVKTTAPDTSFGSSRIDVTTRVLQHTGMFSHDLAQSYQIFAETIDELPGMCRWNALSANATTHTATANIWHSLALILENVQPDPLSSSTEPATRSKVKVPATEFTIRDSLDLGKVWAIRQLFYLSELNADIQTLACMSAMLLGCLEGPIGSHGYRDVGPSIIAVDSETVGTPPAVAALRKISRDYAATVRSPIKRHNSRGSSRDPSQPTTPYLDSFSSAPPFALPPVPRQGPRTFNSGSASPEHSCSSFGAAARFYAQSITDKIAAYGSSPPLKKPGFSPGNELSSSLPVGSLSKSVSFASTTAAGRTIRRGSSLAVAEDDYDSDRTIDDSSTPHTPKMVNDDIHFVQNEQDCYFGEGPGCMTEAPLDNELAAKCVLWRQSYARWLRSHDMLMQAVEFEKLSQGGASAVHDADVLDNAVLPELLAQATHGTCSVCFCAIASAQQFCPVCLHAAHPSCFVDLVTASGADGFVCPTGCGCTCSTMVSNRVEIDMG